MAVNTASLSAAPSLGNVFRATNASSADFADIPGGTGTGAVLAVGSSVSDVIEIDGDTDWFSINLIAGQTYVFELTGTGSTPLGDPLLRLMNAAGVEIAYDDDGGTGVNSRLSFVAGTTGTYFLNVGAYDVSPAAYTGGYTLSATTPTPLPVYSMAQIADYLTDGYWNDTGRARHAFAGSTITYNIEDLTAAGRVWAEEAFHAWAGVTGLNFQRVTTGGQITFDDDQSGANASFVAIEGVTQSSHINVITGWAGPGRNSYSLQTYIHEIGHSLGLGHAGDYNLTGGWSANTGASNHFVNDSWQATVMSYFDQDENTYVNASRAYVIGPMIADIIAIQNLYGVPVNVRAGNTTYGFNSNSIVEHDFAQYTEGNMVAFAIFDSSGIDTLDASGFLQGQFISLAPGTYSNIGGEVGNIGIAVNTIIENAIGGQGADTITGNTSANILSGMAGSDTLNAGQGDDTLIGGAGGDTLRGGLGFDYADYGSALAGVIADLSNSGANTGDAFGDIFNAVEGLNGSAFNDELRGDDGNNALNGRGGNDTLIGGVGADILGGGADDDTLFGGMGADTLSGGAGNDTIAGGQGWDFLFGRDGNDILNGAKGNDQLTGDAGNDTFVFTVGGMADTITDFVGGLGVVDVLQIGMGAAFNTFAEILAVTSQVGNNVLINFGGGDSITLLDTNRAALVVDDFIFV